MTSESADSAFDPRRHRVDLVKVAASEPGQGAEGRVEVRLRAGETETSVTRSGPSGMSGLLETTAEATLAGLRELVPDMPELELTSVDRVLGGGFDVLLVVVRAPDIAERPLAGAIPVVDGDTHRAAAQAALDAVNRIVGR